VVSKAFQDWGDVLERKLGDRNDSNGNHENNLDEARIAWFE
jgi:hypothetical protein